MKEHTKKQTTKAHTMTATHARAHFFELLDAAQFKNTETLIEKNGKVVAKIVPFEEKQFDWEVYLKKLRDLPPLTDQEVKKMVEARESFNEDRFPDW